MVWTQVSIIDFMCEIIYMTWQSENEDSIHDKFCNMMIDFHFKIFDVLKVFFKLML
jgi:hypothetical protein